MVKQEKFSPSQRRQRRSKEILVQAEVVRRRRIRPRTVCGLILFAILAAAGLAPSVVAHPVATRFLLNCFVPRDLVSVSIESIELGWFSAPEVRGVRVLDLDGRPLLEVPRITGNRTLWNLVTADDGWGEFVFRAPTLHVELTHDTSNLEQVFARLAALEEDGEVSASRSRVPFSARIEVVDARVDVHTTQGDETWTTEDLKGTLAAAEDWQLTLHGTLNGSPFSLDAVAPLGSTTAIQPWGSRGHVAFNAEAISVAPLRCLLTRMGLPMDRMAGAMTLQARANWAAAHANEAPTYQAVISVEGQGLELASEAMLSEDTLHLSQLEFNATAKFANDRLRVTQCELNSDLVQASLTTDVEIGGGRDVVRKARSLRTAKLVSAGYVDLAAVARALPNTLRVRDDVIVEDGRATWSIQSGESAQGRTRWTGELKTQDVQIAQAGRPLDWQFPLEIRFSVLDGDEVEVESLTGRSDFFSLAGSGTLRAGSLHAKVDPERLVFELSQVMDVNDVYVRGQAQAFATWQEIEPNQLQLEARTQLEQFVMTQHEQILCQEDALRSSFTATARLDGHRIKSLDQASARLTSTGDLLTIELEEPATMQEPRWPMHCRLQGQLQTWSDRLKPFGVGLDWQVSGDVDATARVVAAKRTLSVHAFRGVARDLSAVSQPFRIAEPIVQLEASGSIDMSTRLLRMPSASLASPTVSLGLRELVMTPGLALLQGDVAFRTDLSRLASYRPDTANRFAGAASGHLRIASEAAETRIELTSEVDDLRVYDANTKAQTWAEPKLKLTGTGSYDALQDQLGLEDVTLSGAAFQLQTAGKIANVASRPRFALEGEIGYDLQRLGPALESVLGPGIRLAGAQRQPFSLHGPILATATARDSAVTTQTQPTPRVAEELTARLQFGWDSATFHGVPVGPATIDAGLRNGVIEIAPIQCAVGGGQAQLAAGIELNSEPMWMTLDDRTRAEQIRITPATTSTWMKYVAPVLADATDAQGTFSLAISNAKIPLTQTSGSYLEGELEIHGGRVGPGPLTRQLIDVGNQIKQLTDASRSRVADPGRAWVDLAPQRVGFHVTDDRVYHDQLQIVIDGVPMRTRGSVGLLDDSVLIEAQVAIPEQWLAASGLAGLRGQSITVPIQGTVSQPMLDRSALARLNTQLVRQAAQGYIGREINDQLDKAVGGSVGDALRSALGVEPQSELGDQLQNEVGRQLDRLFK